MRKGSHSQSDGKTRASLIQAIRVGWLCDLVLQRPVEADDVAAQRQHRPPGQKVMAPGEQAERRINQRGNPDGRPLDGRAPPAPVVGSMVISVSSRASAAPPGGSYRNNPAFPYLQCGNALNLPQIGTNSGNC